MATEATGFSALFIYKWTLPTGYLEIRESAIEGAIRETWEEAGAEVEVISPFAQMDIPFIGQTYVIFLAKLKKPQFSPGPESSECCLFELDNIPFFGIFSHFCYFEFGIYGTYVVDDNEYEVDEWLCK
ncbi:hypothetical protein GOBAR_AA13328 [Gossypium barbadense]|uniref:Nudix hydrolase domain-containing protein n=1 Tax=Gossypium barbadense TaxID=3634 RepID=A0A2P5XVE6_GOSBA|nr:hypothetical protein GOBAR_AA13328 [Gossypium barbadense]